MNKRRARRQGHAVGVAGGCGGVTGGAWHRGGDVTGSWGAGRGVEAGAVQAFRGQGGLLSVVAAGYFGRLGREMWRTAEEAGGEPYSRLRAMGEVYVRFALEGPHRYRLMFGEKMQRSPHPEVHEAAHALYEGFVRAVADCQEAGELPAGDPGQARRAHLRDGPRGRGPRAGRAGGGVQGPRRPSVPIPSATLPPEDPGEAR